MNTLTLSASRTRNRVVILHAFTLRQQSPSLSSRIGKALSAAWATSRRACTAERIIVTATAICACTAFFAALHAIADDSVTARIALAASSAIGLSLAIIGAFNSAAKKGGEL